MNTAMGVGATLTLLGIAAYAFGVVNPYPGRAFSVTALMVGITLTAIGRSLDGKGSASDGVGTSFDGEESSPERESSSSETGGSP